MVTLFLFLWVVLIGIAIALTVSIPAEIYTQTQRTKIVIAHGLLLLAGISLLVVGTFMHSQPIHSKDFKASINIEVKQINGVEVSRDTIYTFTPILK